MKKISFLFVIFISLFHFAQEEQSESNASFSVSLGLSNVDWSADIQTAASGPSDVNGNDGSLESRIIEQSLNYSAPQFGFAVNFGQSSIAVKSTVGDGDDVWDSELASPYVTYTNTFSDAERSETSITYQYKFDTNWSVAFGTTLTEIDMNYDFSGIDPRTATGYTDGTQVAYQWEDRTAGNTLTSSDGYFLAVAYQAQIGDRLFGFGKIGLQQNEYEVTENFSDTYTFSVTDDPIGAWYDAVVASWAEQGLVPNPTFTYDKVTSGDGVSSVIGFGVVYAFTPKLLGIVEYESKSFSYDVPEVDSFNQSTNYSAGYNGPITDFIPDNESEEEVSSFTFSLSFRF